MAEHKAKKKIVRRGKSPRQSPLVKAAGAMMLANLEKALAAREMASTAEEANLAGAVAITWGEAIKVLEMAAEALATKLSV